MIVDYIKERLAKLESKASEIGYFRHTQIINEALNLIEREILETMKRRNRCINGCPHYETSAEGDPYPYERCNKYSTEKHPRSFRDCKMICDWEYETAEVSVNS